MQSVIKVNQCVIWVGKLDTPALTNDTQSDAGGGCQPFKLISL